MNLQELLRGVSLAADVPPGADNLDITGLAFDSRKVKTGFLFFAFQGAKADGTQFAQQAIEQGAVAVCSELPAPEGFPSLWIQVRHGRRALSQIAKTFYNLPDESVAITGVTGTNGKTTTSFLIDYLLRAAGRTTALIGTIEYHLAGRVLPAVNTTPESLDVWQLLAELRDLGGTHATMEISSHALELGRVYGLNVHTAIFTNLTQDHLDFHGTMDRYFASKHMLFTGANGTPPKFAIVNHDDAYGRKLATPNETVRRTYGRREGADLRAVEIKAGFDGLTFVIEHDGRRTPVHSPMVGTINIYNLLAAFATGLTYGLDPEQMAAQLSTFTAVPGRFERVEEGQPFLVLVDYAHTDDALKNAIAAARELKPKRVITLFGCGGDRDRRKRSLMGMAASEHSDFVILTSDNPRSEDPLAILMDAMVGVRRFDTPHVMEQDRAKAIRLALSEAKAGDVVLIAGKGHETYQILKDRTIHFDDREVAREVLHGFGYQKGKPARP